MCDWLSRFRNHEWLPGFVTVLPRLWFPGLGGSSDDPSAYSRRIFQRFYYTSVLMSDDAILSIVSTQAARVVHSQALGLSMDSASEPSAMPAVSF